VRLVGNGFKSLGSEVNLVRKMRKVWKPVRVVANRMRGPRAAEMARSPASSGCVRMYVFVLFVGHYSPRMRKCINVKCQRQLPRTRSSQSRSSFPGRRLGVSVRAFHTNHFPYIFVAFELVESALILIHVGDTVTFV
jgi:hypothetical protein